MDRLQALVALSGDVKNVVFMDDLTWPEIILLRHVHGEAALTDILVVGESDREQFREIDRLRIKFGRRYGEVFHQYETNLPWNAPPYIERFDDEVVEVRRVRRDGKAAEEAPPVHVQQKDRGEFDKDAYREMKIAERRAKAEASRPRTPKQAAHIEKMQRRAAEARAEKKAKAAAETEALGA